MLVVPCRALSVQTPTLNGARVPRKRVEEITLHFIAPCDLCDQLQCLVVPCCARTNGNGGGAGSACKVACAIEILWSSCTGAIRLLRPSECSG